MNRVTFSAGAERDSVGSLTAAPGGMLGQPSPRRQLRFLRSRRDARGTATARGLVAGTLVITAAAGAIGAQYPAVFALLGAVAAGAVICTLAYKRPVQALITAVVLLLLAGTKFRLRSATSSIAGELDAQVVFELALYAAVGAIALVATRSAAFQRRPITGAETFLALYVAVALSSVGWSLTPLLTAVKSVQLAVLLLLCVVATRIIGAESFVHAAAASRCHTFSCARHSPQCSHGRPDAWSTIYSAPTRSASPGSTFTRFRPRRTRASRRFPCTRARVTTPSCAGREPGFAVARS